MNSAEQQHRFVRVSHPALSLWQSSVREIVAAHVAKGDINDARVNQHRLVQEADIYAYRQATAGADVVPRPLGTVNGDDNLFDVALAHAHDVLNRLGGFAESIGRFDNLDPLFLECVWQFVKYYWLANRQPQYRDWTKSPKGLIFGMIEAPISEEAKLAIIGDWGTGLADAEQLLEQLLVEERPDVVIHLGDVYYSGTPAEFQHNFSGPFVDILERHPELGDGPRIYALPGNHDYYAGGSAFYHLIDNLNAEPARQAASYFCLRTEDGHLQFLGMDTGFNDREPGASFSKIYVAPTLHDSETAWLRDKLDNFDGMTVLLSHHQPFSAHSALNGAESGRIEYLNQPLLDVFGDRLRGVAAWFWGHEHNLVLFEEQYGVQRGRLVGCSAFEMTPGDDPYAVLFPAVKVKPTQLGKTGGWFNHACAVLDLAKRSITYRQMPAWIGPMQLAPLTLTAVSGADELLLD